MSQDNKSTYPGAKLDATAPVSGPFNHNQELAAAIAQASPEAREKCEMLRDLADKQFEAEKKSQHNRHQFRLNAAKVKLLENYVKDQARLPEKPDQAQAENDLKIIGEQAGRMVAEKEAYYLDNIGRQAEKNIRLVLAEDRQAQTARHGQQDHEQER